MTEKRQNSRKKINITTIIRKAGSNGGYAVMEFISEDLSLGGVFIATDDLYLFDLGEEVESLIDNGRRKYYAGMAKIVRSVRVFSDEGLKDKSGFGLMFIDPDKDFNGIGFQKFQI